MNTEILPPVVTVSFISENADMVAEHNFRALLLMPFSERTSITESNHGVDKAIILLANTAICAFFRHN